MKKINFFVLLLAISFFNHCKKDEVANTDYSVKYYAYATNGIADVRVDYATIPEEGKSAQMLSGSNTGGNSKVPWSAILASKGYHKAPYYFKVRSVDQLSGWLILKVYQNNVLIKVDSAIGSGQMVELSGSLPK
ncbi:MAG: hypothetical protein SGJ00_07600 [bacterium]|nr:hypothetical protein [bacterium]